MGKPMRIELRYGLVALVIVLGIVAVLFAVFRLPYTWYHLLAGWLAATNLTTFGYYGYDKSQAGAHRPRVPEAVLHGLALAGGSPGAYLGMSIFRHKTVKSAFRIVFWIIVLLQILLILAVLDRLWRHGV
jgi:uncharacterized membrane protein YsdA (DUF1294 family)